MASGGIYSHREAWPQVAYAIMTASNQIIFKKSCSLYFVAQLASLGVSNRDI